MNSSFIAVMPILSALATAIALLMSWAWTSAQRVLHVIGALLFLVSTIMVLVAVNQHGFLVVQIGNYQAPFGISIVIDRLSGVMLALTGVISFSVALYALADINDKRQAYGFFPMFWILVTGISGAFSTGDMFNLYVWFEVMLIASFVLMALGNRKIQLTGTIKYVVLNLLATVLMLVSIALLYGLTGTLNMADMAQHIKQLPVHQVVQSAVLLLALAFAIKSALFPLFFWLPASYHTTSVSASAIFAGMLTKVGVYALLRLFTLIYIPGKYGVSMSVLLVCAGFTMLTGVLGAAAQFNFRRVLSFHIISQVGYMAAGLAIYKPYAMVATVFYIVHHVVVKTNLFLISGIAKRYCGSFNLKESGGLYRYRPGLTILFAISAFSLAGLPPLSGFWAKLLVVQSAWQSHHMVILFVALLVGLLTLFSMLKIWNLAFWCDTDLSNLKTISRAKSIGLYVPVILLASITLVFSFYPYSLYSQASAISDQLSHPQYYINAVLK